MSSALRVMGIDPGYDRLGIGIIAGSKGSEEYVFSTCITTDKTTELADRLVELGTSLSALITEHAPDVLAIENTFFNTNKTTALKVSEARGVVLYEARKAGLTIYEYTPPQIKLAIAGHGHADKQQVTDMVCRLLSIDMTINRLDDEYDALAVALTHTAHT